MKESISIADDQIDYVPMFRAQDKNPFLKSKGKPNFVIENSVPKGERKAQGEFMTISVGQIAGLIGENKDSIIQED